MHTIFMKEEFLKQRMSLYALKKRERKNPVIKTLCIFKRNCWTSNKDKIYFYVFVFYVRGTKTLSFKTNQLTCILNYTCNAINIIYRNKINFNLSVSTNTTNRFLNKFPALCSHTERFRLLWKQFVSQVAFGLSANERKCSVPVLQWHITPSHNS